MGKRFWVGLLIICFLSFFSLEIHAGFSNTGTFDENSYDVKYGSVACGDCDNDGDLDLVVCGDHGGTGAGRITRLFINNGNGSFTATDPGFVGVYYSSLAWGDYNNDGWLDLVIAGNTGSGAVTKLYKNNSGSFIEDISAGSFLAGFDLCSLVWGDYDNDGWIDLLVTGRSNAEWASIRAKLYKNNKGIFTDTGLVFNGAHGNTYGQKFIGCCDYDNDGDLDFAFIGGINKLYENKGDGTFTNSSPFNTDNNPSLAWGDYDNDGWIDIIYQGLDRATRLYKNQGDGSFALFVSPAINNRCDVGTIAWGDFNNDGDLDLLSTGWSWHEGNSRSSKVYQGDGTGNFSEYAVLSIPVQHSAAVWGDYNNDGFLDIVNTGERAGNELLRLFKNTLYTNTSPNTSPLPPSDLNITWSNNDATFSWSAGSDIETLTASLTYNLRVGTSLHGCEVFSVEYSKTPSDEQGPGRGFGNVWHNSNWTIKGLNPDKVYYFEVQTVDNGFSRSPWRQYAIPSMVMLKPAGENAFAENFYQIAWYDEDSRDADEKLIDPAKISLYYDNDKKGYDGTLIVADISIDDSNNFYNWNVFSLENRIYYIYAELSFSGKFVFCYAPGSVKVQHSDIKIVNNVINPVNNDKFSFEFKLSKSMNITAKIFNLQGEPVREKDLGGYFNAGDNKIEWYGKNDDGQIVGMGTYILIVESEEINNKIKIAVVR